MKKKEFVSGVISLSLSMLIIQSASMGFSVYVSSRLGAAQMGLFHLLMSVYSFAITVAVSGVPLAATRLVSEAKSRSASVEVLKKCLGLCLFFGVVSCLMLYAFSDKIAHSMLKDSRCASPLKILAISLPFISASAVIRGYFTGIQKVACITVSRMAEEFSSMFIVITLMRLFGTEQTGAYILTLSAAASSVIACMFDIAMYALAASRYRSRLVSHGKMGDVLSISVPVGLGSYLRSGLVAAENLLIPTALAKSGTVNALARYGTVKAMAMPVITFPYVFLQSFTSLLVPEISGRNARESRKSVIRAARTSLHCTLIFASAIALFLLIFGRSLGEGLYKNESSGMYITALALLAIPMYIDSVTDGLLKGLNQQVYSLKINILDSALRVPVIYLLLPYTGIYGYIAVLYGSELLNLALSARRLKKIL